MNRDEASVSVVIPCYNASKTVERAFLSILEQTLLPKEVVFVDDLSNDDTLEKLYHLKEKHGNEFIKIITLDQNRGPSYARNRGWDLTQNPLVAFLDADDSWETMKLELQSRVMMDDPNIILSGHLRAWGKKLDKRDPFSFSHTDTESVPSWKILLMNVFKTTSTLMVRSDCAVRFPEPKRYAEDYQFVCEIILSGQQAVCINSILAKQYKAPYGSGGLSVDLWRLEKGELDMYTQLHEKKLITWILLPFLYFYSLSKFVRRVLVSRLDSLQRNGS